MRIVATAVTYELPDSRTVLSYKPLLIERGKTVAIVGPSGSGKTTLLGILGGLIKPSSGQVSIDEPSLALHLGFCWIAQGLNSLPGRTAVENAALGAFADGYDRREGLTRAEHALSELQIGHLARTRCQDLSGGELQRVTIARAMCSERPFILADEPTGNLDPAATNGTADALVRASRSGKGVVLVTHDSAVASRCDQLVEL